MAARILFIDRDGTLVEEPADEQVDRLDKVRLAKDVIPALIALRDAGYRFVMVSNQDGLGTTAFPQADFERCHEHILALFSSQGIDFDEALICPHVPDDRCTCRKPATGLLTKFLAGTNLDRQLSAVIGDRDTDLDLADNLGLRGFRFRHNGPYAESWAGIRAALMPGHRRATVSRLTRETEIVASVELDDPTHIDVKTGIGFYDHMLEQVAKHGGFGLTLRCAGDLEVDEHHTVEDSAICLGAALREALGDRKGIARYGFVLPMDESQARVALDLSGRAAFRFKGKFSRDQVGGLPTELVPHFFQSFAESLGAALHVKIKGENNHHMVEACFKAVGRSLRQAIHIESTELPSTKGLLG